MNFEVGNALSFLSADYINSLYLSMGLNVIPRSENVEIWETTLSNCSYSPTAYTNMNVEFLFEYQKGHDVLIYDLSSIIIWDNRPVAIWPLFLSIQNNTGNLFFLDNKVLPPQFTSICAASSEKQIIKNSFRFASIILAQTGGKYWESMESFTDKSSLSAWHINGMALGATCNMYHDSFLNISPDLSKIKAQFRKSYKSLITSGLNLWKVGVLDSYDLSIWTEFKELHLKVAERKTRSDKTWSIHLQDIQNQKSFLVYLRNAEGVMIGAGLFNFTRDEGLYAVAAYDRSLFDKPVGHVVQFRAIEEFKKRGVRWYKLGPRPYAKENSAPSEKELSIGDFKQGFSSHLFPRIILSHIVAESLHDNSD